MPTVRAFNSCQTSALLGKGGWGPEVNKFEQVSSDGHQILLAGKEGIPVQWDPILEGGPWVPVQ